MLDNIKYQIRSSRDSIKTGIRYGYIQHNLIIAKCTAFLAILIYIISQDINKIGSMIDQCVLNQNNEEKSQ